MFKERPKQTQTTTPATDLYCKYTAIRVPYHSSLSLCHVPLDISTLAVLGTPVLWDLNKHKFHKTVFRTNLIHEMSIYEGISITKVEFIREIKCRKINKIFSIKNNSATRKFYTRQKDNFTYKQVALKSTSHHSCMLWSSNKIRKTTFGCLVPSKSSLNYPRPIINNNWLIRYHIIRIHDLP